MHINLRQWLTHTVTTLFKLIRLQWQNKNKNLVWGLNFHWLLNGFKKSICSNEVTNTTLTMPVTWLLSNKVWYMITPERYFQLKHKNHEKSTLLWGTLGVHVPVHEITHLRRVTWFSYKLIAVRQLRHKFIFLPSLLESLFKTDVLYALQSKAHPVDIFYNKC